MPRDEPDPTDDETSGDADEAPSKPARRRRSSRHRDPEPDPAPGLTEWKDDSDGGRPSEEPTPDDDDKPRKEPVYFRARDSVWFEPLVFLMAIVVLLVALFAYTSNWPPMYVVESESMQHGYSDQVGLINTGDLVLAQKIPTSQIVPYLVGLKTGYMTYGEYGDVILYHPYDNTSEAPIIHRAILWMQYNPNGTYTIPDLNGLACGAKGSGIYSVTTAGGQSSCATSGLHPAETLTLYGIGWTSAEVDIPLDAMGGHSGFLTMGDNNFVSGDSGVGIPDQVGGLSTLVEPGWIVGVARGMLPWFGSIKLALDGNAGEVPPQSWQYMGLTILGVVLAALGLHLFLRSRGVEDPRRKAEEDEADDDETPPKRRGRGSPAADDEEEGSPHRKPRHPKPSDDDEEEPPARAHRGRPKPKVGRPPPSDDDGDDD